MFSTLGSALPVYDQKTCSPVENVGRYTSIERQIVIPVLQCPYSCKCSAGLVDCAGQRLSALPNPEFLPRGTHTLLLGRNSLASADMREVCGKHGGLTKISLEHNHINQIRGIDFMGCSEVEELDLSYNNIAIITQNFLTGLPKLKKLKILGNYIICFDKKSLQQFAYIPVIEIDLRFLECNCQSKWVLEW